MTAPGAPPPEYVLVTFIVSRDGDSLKPFTETIARVDLDQDGNPVSLDDLNDRVRRAIDRLT